MPCLQHQIVHQHIHKPCMTILLRVAVKLLPVMTVVRLGSQYNIQLLIKTDAERCSIFFSFLFFSVPTVVRLITGGRAT